MKYFNQKKILKYFNIKRTARSFCNCVFNRGYSHCRRIGEGTLKNQRAAFANHYLLMSLTTAVFVHCLMEHILF
jgi:hypothetical protein